MPKRIKSAVAQFDSNTYVIDLDDEKFYRNELNNFIQPYGNIIIDNCSISAPDILDHCYYKLNHFCCTGNGWGYHYDGRPCVLIKHSGKKGYTSIDQFQSNMPLKLRERLTKIYNLTNGVFINCSPESRNPWQVWWFEDIIALSLGVFKPLEPIKCSLWSPESAGEYWMTIEIQEKKKEINCKHSKR